MSKRLTNDEFIVRAKQIHGDKYDYSLSNYESKDKCVKIICPFHGIFEQTPNNHWKGKGCSKCSRNKKRSTQEFVKEANIIHQNKYNYMKTQYVNDKTPVIITCLEHGDFLQTPDKHLMGRGCPDCGNIKIKYTNLQKYGVEYAIQSTVVQSHIKETNLCKYGVENPGGLDFVQEKIKQTNIKRYGVEYAVSSPIVREKAQMTMRERYGVNTPFESKNIKEKATQTCLKKYGVRSPFASKEIREKIKDTNIARYGVEQPLTSVSIRNKIRESIIKTYGVDNVAKSSMVQSKIQQSKRENGTFNTSKAEETLYELLVSTFGENDVKRQYKSDAYPFMCDFYIKSRDMYIELNAMWTHDDHFFDVTNPNDVAQMESWKRESIDHPFYIKAIENWTIRDVKKYKIAKENHLNYVVFWQNDLSDAIEWFNNGCLDNVL